MTGNIITLPIVFARDGQAFTDSREVAKSFEKNHFDVLKAIRNLDCSDEFRECNFASFKIKDLTGWSTSHVDMTRDGFTFLAMGFTGHKAAQFKEKYIAAFNAMEAQLRSSAATFDDLIADPKRLRAALLAYSEKVDQLQEQVADLKPRSEAFERLESSRGSICISTAAKELGIKPKDFFAFLSRNRLIFRRSGDGPWVAYQDLIDDGSMEMKPHQVVTGTGAILSVPQVLITPRGLAWLAAMLNIKKVG